MIDEGVVIRLDENVGKGRTIGKRPIEGIGVVVEGGGIYVLLVVD